jgi:hypothetical protein
LSSELLCSIISWQYSASGYTFSSTHKAYEVSDPWHTLLLPTYLLIVYHTQFFVSPFLWERLSLFCPKDVLSLVTSCMSHHFCTHRTWRVKDWSQGGPINTVNHPKSHIQFERLKLPVSLKFWQWFLFLNRDITMTQTAHILSLVNKWIPFCERKTWYVISGAYLDIGEQCRSYATQSYHFRHSYQ